MRRNKGIEEWESRSQKAKISVYKSQMYRVIILARVLKISKQKVQG